MDAQAPLGHKSPEMTALWREVRGPERVEAAMQALCEQRYEQFGATGQAGRITPLPLEEMARRYLAGTLHPKVH